MSATARWRAHDERDKKIIIVPTTIGSIIIIIVIILISVAIVVIMTIMMTKHFDSILTMILISPLIHFDR